MSSQLDSKTLSRIAGYTEQQPPRCSDCKHCVTEEDAYLERSFNSVCTGIHAANGVALRFRVSGHGRCRFFEEKNNKQNEG